MNKKYLSVILFGALMLGTTGTFTSCKDYDDDINQINKELTDIKSAISELQSKVDNGKYVTNITKEGEGIKITWNDNSTSVIETIKGDKGADGTIVTIVDGYWAFDGVKSEYPATGKDGANGEDGKDGADGHDAKISEDGYWMVWDAEKGEYAKTEYIAGGATAIAGEHGWTIVVRDENGEEQRIYIPNSADLVGIEDALGEEGNYQIFYGLVNQAVDWDGAKGGADKKMQAGMYPVLDRNVMVMLNPTGVDATAYKFEFRPSDNKELWGLTFADMEPYAGEKLTRAASESGIWVLPRTIERVELTGLDQRVDYVTQFKQNDGKMYAFALTATSKANASQVVKSQYIYTFDPKNVGNLEAKSFKAKQYKFSYVWNEYHTPDFSGWVNQAVGSVGDIATVSLDQVIYDYKIEIDKTKMTQVNIDKYGLEISEDGYSFIATKEAAVDNTVYLTISYILVNGSKSSLSYKAHITAKDMVITDSNIGTINEAFNAVYTTNSNIADLNNHYVLGAKELAFNPKEVLGTNYDEWIDAMYTGLTATGVDKAAFLKKNVSILGGDPVNNDATYNNALVQNFLYFDYVDANGKSCIYNVANADVLSKLADIAAVKVYFIAAVAKDNGNSTYTISQKPVETPFYTVQNAKEDWAQGFAIPLNNAFSVQVATAKEEQVVAAFTFKFQLTQPDIETVGIVPQNGEFTSWEYGTAGDANLVSFGAYDKDKMGLPLYEAFDMWTGKAPAIYSEMNKNAQYYNLSIGEQIASMIFLGDRIENTLDKNIYQTDWKQYNTYVMFNCPLNKPANNAEAEVNVDVTYHFFGVYPALAEQLPYYIEGNNKYPGFKLIFASTIGWSTLETKEATYYAKAGDHYVFISNDDITATTRKEKEFVLFNGIDANGNVTTRAKLNDERGFNEDIRPFVKPTEYEITAVRVGDGEDVDIDGAIVNATTLNPVWNVNVSNGTIAPAVPEPANNAKVKVYLWPSSQKYAVGDATYPNGLPAVESGFVIQLGKQIDNRQPIEVTIRVKDTWGYYSDLKVVVQKLQ